MEVIGVTSGRHHPLIGQGPRTVILTFDGLREAKVRDRDTLIRITLQGANAARLWRLLSERLTDEEKTLD
jgi:hypothetical protein